MSSRPGFFSNFTERERKLLSLLGVLVIGMTVFGTGYLVFGTIGDIQKENQEILDALETLHVNRAELWKAAGERKLREERYLNKVDLTREIRRQQELNKVEFRESSKTQGGPEKPDTALEYEFLVADIQRGDIRTAINMLYGIEELREIKDMPIALQKLSLRPRSRNSASREFDFDLTYISFMSENATEPKVEAPENFADDLLEDDFDDEDLTPGPPEVL
jgi:hypothetical protein